MWINFDEEFLPALGALCSFELERFSSSLFSTPTPSTYLPTYLSIVPINPFKPTPPHTKEVRHFWSIQAIVFFACNELSPIITEFLCTNLEFVSSSQSIGSFMQLLSCSNCRRQKEATVKKTQLRSKIQALMQHNFAWKLLLTAPSPIHQYYTTAATPTQPSYCLQSLPLIHWAPTHPIDR